MSASGNVSVKQMAIHLSEIIIIIFTLFFVVSVYSSTERVSDVSCDDVAKAVLGEDMTAPDRSVAGTNRDHNSEIVFAGGQGQAGKGDRRSPFAEARCLSGLCA